MPGCDMEERREILSSHTLLFRLLLSHTFSIVMAKALAPISLQGIRVILTRMSCFFCRVSIQDLSMATCFSSESCLDHHLGKVKPQSLPSAWPSEKILKLTSSMAFRKKSSSNNLVSHVISGPHVFINTSSPARWAQFHLYCLWCWREASDHSKCGFRQDL